MNPTSAPSYNNPLFNFFFLLFYRFQLLDHHLFRLLQASIDPFETLLFGCGNSGVIHQLWGLQMGEVYALEEAVFGWFHFVYFEACYLELGLISGRFVNLFLIIIQGRRVFARSIVSLRCHSSRCIDGVSNTLLPNTWKLGTRTVLTEALQCQLQVIFVARIAFQDVYRLIQPLEFVLVLS